MKKTLNRILCCLMAICTLTSLLCTTASARSSDYLDAYRAGVVAKSGGKLVIAIDVCALGTHDMVGTSKINLYESSNGVDFTRIKTYNYKDYPKMMAYNTFSHVEDVVTYNGTPGKYYFADVCFYAGKDGGYDEKWYSTAAVKAYA